MSIKAWQDGDVPGVCQPLGCTLCLLRHTCFQKAPGVRMGGLLEELSDRGNLHDSPSVENGHPIGDLPDHCEVVGHENEREGEPFAEVHEKIQYLGLYGKVQGRNGLVQDQELGLDRKGAGNPQPLALPSAELVGKATPMHRMEPHQFEESFRRFPQRSTTVCLPSHEEHLLQHGSRPKPRVQRPERILEDDLCPLPKGRELASRHGEHVLPLEKDLPTFRLDEAKKASRQCRLPSARLSHHPQTLPSFNVEAGVVQDLKRIGTPTPRRTRRLESVAQVSDGYQGSTGSGACLRHVPPSSLE